VTVITVTIVLVLHQIPTQLTVSLVISAHQVHIAQVVTTQLQHHAQLVLSTPTLEVGLSAIANCVLQVSTATQLDLPQPLVHVHQCTTVKKELENHPNFVNLDSNALKVAQNQLSAHQVITRTRLVNLNAWNVHQVSTATSTTSATALTINNHKLAHKDSTAPTEQKPQMTIHVQLEHSEQHPIWNQNQNVLIVWVVNSVTHPDSPLQLMIVKPVSSVVVVHQAQPHHPMVQLVVSALRVTTAHLVQKHQSHALVEPSAPSSEARTLQNAYHVQQDLSVTQLV